MKKIETPFIVDKDDFRLMEWLNKLMISDLCASNLIRQSSGVTLHFGLRERNQNRN